MALPAIRTAGPTCPLCLAPLYPGPGLAEQVARCPACDTLHHASCVDELEVECGTPGCVHAGRTEPPPHRRWLVSPPPWLARLLAGVAAPLLGAWLVYAAAASFALAVDPGELWLAVLPPTAVALWRARRRSRWAVAAVVLLGPLVVVPGISAGVGAQDHATGRAELTVEWADYVGLDPEVRCRQRQLRIYGGPSGPNRPYEVAVRLLAGLFGPDPRGWDGRLPPAAEVAALLSSAPLVGVVQGVDPYRSADRLDVLTLDGRVLPIEVDWKLSRRAFDDQRGRYDASGAPVPLGPLRVVRLDAATLALAPFRDPHAALLVDLRRREVVALVQLQPWDYRY